MVGRSADVAAQSSGTGQPVNIAWDANSEAVQGYVVFVGTSSQSYGQTYDVGPATTFSFVTGNSGQTYYFAVAAYVSGGVMGARSDEVSVVIPASSSPQTPPEPTPAPTPNPNPIPNPTPGDTPPPVPVAITSNGGSCRALVAPTGRILPVTPIQANVLTAIVGAAQPGDTIQFADGVYALKAPIVVSAPRVTLRSQSGNRQGVILDGAYTIDDLIVVNESDVTIADLTLTRSRNRGVRVAPANKNIYGTILHNVRISDTWSAALSIAPVAGFFADNGVVECSAMELTDTGRAAMQSRCDAAGISADAAANWQVAVNTFSGFWCASGSAGPAVRFGAGSRGTVVDRSTVLNSARGIVLGMAGTAPERTYADQPCSGRSPVGHYGGVVVDNAVAAFDSRVLASGDGFQVGIVLEQSCGTNVLHNTVASLQPPRTSSIEWRLPNTSATIANNLATHTLSARDGATGTTGGNLPNAPLSYFVDAATGNLHLNANALGALDRAAPLSTPLGWDLDGEARSTLADIGADEFAGVRFTLSATSQATSGQSISVVWTGDASAVTSSDTVGLFAVGAADTAAIDRKSTGGLAAGTLLFTAPASAGSYEFRYFNTSSQVRVASSGSITVSGGTSAPPPGNPAFSLTAPSQAIAGQPLTVSWSGDPWKITPSDTIGLFAAGAADSAPLVKRSTGALTSGTLTFTAPATAGTYEFRYFNGSLQTRVATTNPIAVSSTAPPPATIPFTVAGPPQATSGQTLSASWSGDPTKVTPSDSIGLFAVGAADSAPVDKKFTGGATTGSLAFTAPATAGSYEFRYFNGASQIRVAASGSIAVTAPSTPPPSSSSFTLTGPSQATAGQAISAAWSGDPWKITPSDTIGLFVVGAADSAPIVKKSTGALTSGTLPFTAPSTAGAYEFRYFNGSQQIRVATSGAIVVSGSTPPPSTPPPTASFTLTAPTQATSGQALTVTWSGDPWKITPSDAIGLFAVGAADSAPILKQATGALTTGSLAFTAPSTAGSYEFRYFNGSQQTRVATSAAIAVSGSTPPPSTPPPTASFTLTAPTQATSGQALTVTWSGDPWKITPSDAIGLFAVGAADSAAILKQATSALTTGSLTFTAPSTAGTYEFRYFNGSQQIRVATSAAITVSGSTPPPSTPPPPTASFTLTAPALATGGQPLSVTWSGDPWKITPSDTIGLFAVGAADSAAILKLSTGALTAGSLTFTAPSTAGSYEFRYFNGSQQIRVATSAAIAVSGSAPPPSTTPPTASFTLTAPAQAIAGQVLSATWSGDPWKITPSDSIGLFAVGASDSAPILKKFTGALTSGTLAFTAPATPGTYEFRYFNGSQQIRVAVSNVIVVTASTPPISDITTPTVRILLPSPNAVVPQQATIAAEATDNVAVASVSLYVDSVLIQTLPGGTSPYVFFWNTTSAAPGAHTIQVRATDAAGNSGFSSPLTVLK